jgi:hypothetical protein
MVRACVSGWTWSSGSQDRAPVEGQGSDGKEDVRRDRDKHIGNRWERLDLDRSELRKLVRAAAAAPAAANANPDLDSADYREAHEAARRELIRLAETGVMKPLPAARPPDSQ